MCGRTGGHPSRRFCVAPAAGPTTGNNRTERSLRRSQRCWGRRGAGPGSGDRASTIRYPLVSALSPVVSAPLRPRSCARTAPMKPSRLRISAGPRLACLGDQPSRGAQVGALPPAAWEKVPRLSYDDKPACNNAARGGRRLTGAGSARWRMRQKPVDRLWAADCRLGSVRRTQVYLLRTSCVQCSGGVAEAGGLADDGC